MNLHAMSEVPFGILLAIQLLLCWEGCAMMPPSHTSPKPGDNQCHNHHKRDVDEHHAMPGPKHNATVLADEVDYQYDSKADACLITTCKKEGPMSMFETTEVEVCSNHTDTNCSKSEISTTKEQSILICCGHCSECDFISCPEKASCKLKQDNTSFCQCASGYILSDSACIDVDECLPDNSNPCPSNSDCSNTNGSFSCSCHQGYVLENDTCIARGACANIDCPQFSQCHDHDGLYECICGEDQECEFTITRYYMTTPSGYSESTTNESQQCAFDDSIDASIFEDHSIVVCDDSSSLVLADGVTGVGLPLSSVQYIQWNSKDVNRSFTVLTEFASTRPTQVDIYFIHSPAMGIGLPEVSSVFMYRNLSDINGNHTHPVSFFYANNQHLSQTDNTTRMIALVISDINPSYGQFMKITFDFFFQSITTTQLTEIKVLGGSGTPVVDEGGIVFVSGANRVHVGPHNPVSTIRLSCGVVNEGSFLWSWTGPHDEPLDTSRTMIFVADLTRTSILEIHNLSLGDAGQYTCTAAYNDQAHTQAYTNSTTIELSLGSKTVTNSPVFINTGDEIANLSCEFMGYFPAGDIQIWWDFEGNLVRESDTKYTVFTMQGDFVSQRGGDSHMPSILSMLTISTISNQDVGVYGCRLVGESCIQLTGYIQLHMASDPVNLSTVQILPAPTAMVQASEHICATVTPVQMTFSSGSSIHYLLLSGILMATLTFLSTGSSLALG